MKNAILIFVVALMTITSLDAQQRYMVVDSKKIFDSNKEYQAAIKKLTIESKVYQLNVDERFDDVERAFNNYMSKRSSLSVSQRANYEAQIQKSEDEAKEYQESIFGEGGTLQRHQQELLEPIQNHIMKVIEGYAKDNEYDMVLDAATMPSLLYRSPSIEKTEEIIKKLK